MSIPSWRRWLWRTGTATVLIGSLGTLVAGRYELLFGTVAGSTPGEPPLASCLPGEPVDIMDSPYVAPAEADAAVYLSLPPTSGPHFTYTIATGVYETSVPDGLAVRALEYGHIVIRYAPATAGTEVAELRWLAKRYGADVVLAPYPKLDTGIALTAWGRIDRLDRYDEKRIAAFVERLRGRYHHGWTTDDPC
jgi:Protein of unknown function (DUF3105)